MRLRILFAAVFLCLAALVPGPDPTTGNHRLALLQVRSWLLDPAATPLPAWVRDGTVPPLGVDLHLSPPLEDPAVYAAAVATYRRIAEEWALAATASGQPVRIASERGQLPLLVHVGLHGVRCELPRPDGTAQVWSAPFPGRSSLLPAVVAITVAILFRSVLVALLLGCLVGGFTWAATALGAASTSLLDTTLAGLHHAAVDAFVERALLGDFYLTVTVFVVGLFGTVALCTANGGLHGMLQHLQRRVRTPAGAERTTFLAGLLVFFDDYSNCLLVGSTMRPLCDRLRVSREKLAWLVDSTAAPVAGLSVLSTWITYEISQFRTPLQFVTKADGTPYLGSEAYGVFVATLPYRFYCWLTLALVAAVVLLRRDFGPMLAAERRCRATPVAPSAAPQDAPPPRAWLAVLPLACLVFGAFAGMLWHGLSAAPPATPGLLARLQHLLANAHAVESMCGAALVALATAVAGSLGSRALSFGQVLTTLRRALRDLLPAFGLLFLAWTLGHLAEDLGTSRYLCAGLQDGIAAAWLPAAVFLLAAGIAFATGSSFGTMAILLPNVVLLAHRVGTAAAFDGSGAAGGPALLVLCLGAVLEGAIFGDHCSPLSDTTVLSSLGAACDHLAHVRTQLPYAMLTCVVALASYLVVGCCGTAAWPYAMGGSLLALLGFLRRFGADPDTPVTAAARRDD